MKIPQPLPQFENLPSLFIVAGQFESKLYVALNGNMEEKDSIKLSMREEGREKQRYEHNNPAPEAVGAVSHYGSYKKDLIEKFHRQIAEKVYNLIYDENIDSIYVFSPEYAMSGIVKNLKTRAKNKIKGEFIGEYTNLSPKEILEVFSKKTAKNSFDLQSEEEKKIMEKPEIKY